MSKTTSIEKLLIVKSLRRKLAEMEAMRAHATVLASEDAANQATAQELAVKSGSVQLRQERISNLLRKPDNISVQNALIGNVFVRTEFEIEQAVAHTAKKQEELLVANQDAVEKQKNLARFLQKEESAKQLFDRLKTAENQEAMRLE